MFGFGLFGFVMKCIVYLLWLDLLLCIWLTCYFVVWCDCFVLLVVWRFSYCLMVENVWLATNIGRLILDLVLVLFSFVLNNLVCFSLICCFRVSCLGLIWVMLCFYVDCLVLHTLITCLFLLYLSFMFAAVFTLIDFFRVCVLVDLFGFVF